MRDAPLCVCCACQKPYQQQEPSSSQQLLLLPLAPVCRTCTASSHNDCFNPSAAVLVWSWPWTMCCPVTWATTSTSVSPKLATWLPSLELSTLLPGQWAASSLT